jgi:NCS2 family nucleobase:cation symporter-2
LGGAGILMFGTAAAAVQPCHVLNSTTAIRPSSFLRCVGLGVSFVPDTVAQLPGILSGLFSSGSGRTIVALVLNIILKEKSKHGCLRLMKKHASIRLAVAFFLNVHIYKIRYAYI